MPREPYGHCLFCDDIRDEIGGKTSYMGVYDNNLRVTGNGFVLLPKLAIVAFVFIPSGLKFHKLHCVTLKVKGDEEEMMVEFQSDISSLPENSKEGTLTSLNLNMTSIPFRVAEDFEVLVRLSLDETVIELGRLDIQFVESNAIENPENSNP